ncbi:MAG: SDR family NAD(P)-dependent oxidoreductase [Thermoleophilia bacterium]|nr:SDR family NAD(P)-dependent oxidoreductase [Thermoleophilia bacterium]
MASRERMELAGKRFLVTGGTGFIGSYVVDALVEAGAGEVVAFDAQPRAENVESASARGNVRVLEGDVRDVDAVRRAAEGADGVFHLAVLPLRPCVDDPRLCLDVNVVGTFNLLEAAQRAGARKVVVSSASSVYGDTHATMDESHPLAGRTMYAASKIAGESFARAFHDGHGLDYVVLRYMNVYGPRQAGGLIASVLGRLRAGEPPVVQGDGSQSFDFVHVADVASANLRAMEADVTDEAFNVGSGGEATVREIVEHLIRLTGSELKPVYDTETRVLMTRRVGSNEKAVRLLGWRPGYDLERGLRDVVEAA